MTSLTAPAAARLPSALAQVRGVILDLDGTLYCQKKLRLRMALDLWLHLLSRPWAFQELLILFHFRRLHERLAREGAAGVSKSQFQLTATKCNCEPHRVMEVVDTWIYRRPLRYLNRFRYPLVDALLSLLSQHNIAIAVLSDHPPQAKLKALGLDGVFCCSSLDPAIDRLKPDPAGLLHICKLWGMAPGDCLVIGDRDERDGEAARRAGMRSLVLPDGLDFKTVDQLFQSMQ